MAGKKPKPRGWCYKPGTPLLRGFDTSALFREDTVLRTRWLTDGIAESRREVEKTKGKSSNRKRRDGIIKQEMEAINRSQERNRSTGALPTIRPGLADTVKVTMPWKAFFELRRKYPKRVLKNMNTGRVLFTDRSVILHIPFTSSGRTSSTLLH